MASREATTGPLLQLCGGYFLAYVVTAVSVKYLLGPAAKGFPGLHGLQLLIYSTAGGTALTTSVVLAFRWYKLRTQRYVAIGPLRVPVELCYIVPSGVCTAIVIPTTTLMYTLPISVMVAMVVMRASVIVISRAVDAIQIRQGILTRRVYPEEDIAVGLALAAIAIHLVDASASAAGSVLRSNAALAILGSYVVAYAIRIYIMNYFKHTRPPGVAKDNRGFFGIEQITATVTLLCVTALVFAIAPRVPQIEQLGILRQAIVSPEAAWPGATASGVAFGAAAFFSVFLFLYPGRTATFAGLVNRLTSLVAGTTATLIFATAFGGRFPATRDWISLTVIGAAVGFLARAERRRTRELTLSAGDPARG
ncbi:MAG: hypothetical protein ACYS22_06580 [Planctomycetota bacterium]|jgi:hypothetical protein